MNIDLTWLMGLVTVAVGIVGIGVGFWSLRNTAKAFAIEVWGKLTPYFMHIIVDALITSTLWISLWFFKLLTRQLNVTGEVGELIENMHSVGAILAFFVFFILVYLDIRMIREKQNNISSTRGN